MTAGICVICDAPHDRAAIRLPESLLFELAREALRQGGLNTHRPPDETPVCSHGHPQTADTVKTAAPSRYRYLHERCRTCEADAGTRSRARARTLARLGQEAEPW